MKNTSIENQKSKNEKRKSKIENRNPKNENRKTGQKRSKTGQKKPKAGQKSKKNLRSPQIKIKKFSFFQNTKHKVTHNKKTNSKLKLHSRKESPT